MEPCICIKHAVKHYFITNAQDSSVSLLGLQALKVIKRTFGNIIYRSVKRYHIVGILYGMLHSLHDITKLKYIYIIKLLQLLDSLDLIGKL